MASLVAGELNRGERPAELDCGERPAERGDPLASSALHAGNLSGSGESSEMIRGARVVPLSLRKALVDSSEMRGEKLTPVSSPRATLDSTVDDVARRGATVTTLSL